MEERSFDARVRKGDGTPPCDPVKSKEHRILVVDDHPIVCRGLQLLMANQPDMEICAKRPAFQSAPPARSEHAGCRHLSTSLSKVAMGWN